ncbi:2365_t:CDS:2 [Funneliformis caledonium]|uniref:2365_t:CDS:1 n=1 Tax=Funneliformis caledonium TaxID=1117310 RepID=A0A9N9HTR5_9GLOM|nr:2365_t:CDS:2 [Funneliformis caledonium]
MERSRKENSSDSLPGHILLTKNRGNVQASSTEEEDYLKMITGSIDEETAYWGTPYEARIEKENKTS